MQIDANAILALQTDLVQRLTIAENEIARLQHENAALREQVQAEPGAE